MNTLHEKNIYSFHLKKSSDYLFFRLSPWWTSQKFRVGGLKQPLDITTLLKTDLPANSSAPLAVENTISRLPFALDVWFSCNNSVSLNTTTRNYCPDQDAAPTLSAIIPQNKPISSSLTLDPLVLALLS